MNVKTLFLIPLLLLSVPAYGKGEQYGHFVFVLSLASHPQFTATPTSDIFITGIDLIIETANTPDHCTYLFNRGVADIPSVGISQSTIFFQHITRDGETGNVHHEFSDPILVSANTSLTLQVVQVVGTMSTCNAQGIVRFETK